MSWPLRLRRGGAVLAGMTILCTLAAPRPGAAQAVPPGGTTPGGTIFDRLRDQSTRPVPQPGPAPSRRPGGDTIPQPPPAPARRPGDDMLWVPDRQVRVPGVEGSVRVPGHWEQRVSEHEVYVPPLTGQTQDGRVIEFPAGRQKLPDARQSP